MLDTINSNPTMTAAWQDHLSYGDIVSFRFPLAEGGHTGRPKARPCLVLDIEERGGQRYALLAYGTTSRRRTNIGYEVHVRRRTDYLSAGLNESTRFVGARRLLVPLNHSGFVIHGATGAPVLGRLDGNPFDAMNAVGGRIHAEHDIAADRRSHTRSRGAQGASCIPRWKGGARVISTSSTTLFDQQLALLHAVIALRHGMAEHLRKRVLPHLDSDVRERVHDTIEFLEEQEEDIGINLLCLVDNARAEVRKAIAAGTSEKRVPIPRERLIGIDEAYDVYSVLSPEAEALTAALLPIEELVKASSRLVQFAKAVRLSAAIVNGGARWGAAP